MYWIGMVSALWLGVLTSISPCPLATNITAISFIGRNLANARLTLLSGLAYTLGRMITYIVIGAVVVIGVLSIPGVSNFLQNYMNKIMGPLLIVVGMFLLELISINLSSGIRPEKLQAGVEKGGILASVLLGVVFALAFCPVSAALFFGSLIPLAIKHGSRFVFPAIYGIGTALPVVVFAVLIATGARSVSSAFNRTTQFELWARRITGAIFVLVGIYLSLKYIFEVPLIF